MRKRFLRIFIPLLLSQANLKASWAAPLLPCIGGATPTELGDFCNDPSLLIKNIIIIIVGVVGVISFGLFVLGAFKYVASSGNPEGIEDAKGTITSALTGLLLVLLSVFLVRFIGFDILQIPGLTGSGSGGFTTP